MLLSLLLTMVQVQSSYILCTVILFETLNTLYHVGDQIFELKILYLLFQLVYKDCDNFIV